MEDCYEHIESGVIYVTENILGPPENCEEYKELEVNFNSQLTINCSCCENCSDEEGAMCQCLLISGGKNYTVYLENDKLCHKLCTLNISDVVMNPIVECNSLCLCSQNCGNRVVQKGPFEGLYIRETTGKGKGLFASTFIQTGTFICEYAGELITKKQALERQHNNLQKGKRNYILCLNEYSSSRVTQTIVDPMYLGNIGRYINHSCLPNCHIVPVRVNSPVPKIAIFSSEDIPAHSELTFHYGPHKLADLVSSDRQKCFCNTFKCTGFLPYDSY